MKSQFCLRGRQVERPAYASSCTSSPPLHNDPATAGHCSGNEGFRRQLLLVPSLCVCVCDTATVGKWENADWKSHRCGWHSVFLSLCPLILCCCFCLSFLSAFVASPVAATVLRMPATIAGGSAPGKALKCFFMLCQLSQGNCLPLGQLPAACCMLHASCCLPHAASFAIAVSHASLLIRVAPGSCATTTRR